MNRSIPDERGNYQVLILDDSEIFLDAVFELVQLRIGTGILGTTSECLAMEIANTFRPHLIFIDLDLPCSGGMDLIPRFRELVPQSRIVAMSLFDDEVYRKVAISSGANDFFCKSDLVNLFPMEW